MGQPGQLPYSSSQQHISAAGLDQRSGRSNGRSRFKDDAQSGIRRPSPAVGFRRGTASRGGSSRSRARLHPNQARSRSRSPSASRSRSRSLDRRSRAQRKGRALEGEKEQERLKLQRVHGKMKAPPAAVLDAKLHNQHMQEVRKHIPVC